MFIRGCTHTRAHTRRAKNLVDGKTAVHTNSNIYTDEIETQTQRRVGTSVCS